jgi:hypothetical protein
MSGFPPQGGPVSLGGTGISTLGGTLITLSATGANRNFLDDGSGDITATNAISAGGVLKAGTGLRVQGVLAKSITYNMAASDFGVFATGGAGGITITLSTTPQIGTINFVKKVDSGAGAIVVTPSTGTLDGAASVSLPTQFESVICSFDGTNWQIIGQVAASIL